MPTRPRDYAKTPAARIKKLFEAFLWACGEWALPLFLTLCLCFGCALLIPLLLFMGVGDQACKKLSPPVSLSTQLQQIRNDIAEQDKTIKGLQQHVIDILHSKCNVLEDRAKGICDCEENGPDWDASWGAE